MTKNVQAKTWSLTVQNGRRWSAGPPSGLSFSQPPTQSLAPNTSASVNLTPYVAGGGSARWWHLLSGAFPKDISLGTTTGIAAGTAREIGTFSPYITVTDVLSDALEKDWVRRSTASGVKWAHDFRTSDEVDKFSSHVETSPGVWGPQLDGSGTPQTRRTTLDGITGGGCLELFTPAGSHNNMAWCRPFACLPGDRGYQEGRDSDVPAAWKTTGRFNWVRGLYGHRDYHTDDPASGYNGAYWDGVDFYIQFRVKGINVYDPTHQFNQNFPGGKLAFIDLAAGGNQEIVIQNPTKYGSRMFSMYTNFYKTDGGNLGSNQPDTYIDQPEGNAQPGGGRSGCVYGAYNTGCWVWPENEWTTVLLHVIPGHHNGNSDGPKVILPDRRRDTGIEVWVAAPGETSYTKIWEKLDYAWNWDASAGPNDKYGFNIFSPSQYMNNKVAGSTGWYRRFDQVIFSTSFIDCPQVYS